MDIKLVQQTIDTPYWGRNFKHIIDQKIYYKLHFLTDMFVNTIYLIKEELDIKERDEFKKSKH